MVNRETKEGCVRVEGDLGRSGGRYCSPDPDLLRSYQDHSAPPDGQIWVTSPITFVTPLSRDYNGQQAGESQLSNSGVLIVLNDVLVG